MNILVIIPARGGSKGIPHKNVKELNGKPLICYSIDAARQLTTDENICVSTDDDVIIKVVEDYGLKVHFKRPAELATDCAGTNGVLLHALEFYEKQGRKYDVVVLLQPTSPFRETKSLKEAVALYTSDIDMVVSVKEAATNPYYNSFEEDAEGLLVISIFQPFFRVDKSRSREYGGAGLGLSLVWEIADLHGGSVWVEKSSEKGTTIAVGLPTQQSTKP